MEKIGYVYIMASGRNGTLYTGVTSNLIERIYKHKHNLMSKEAFTAKYGVHTLVYYEGGGEIYYAIKREKKIKKMLRKDKLALINADADHLRLAVQPLLE